MAVLEQGLCEEKYRIDKRVDGTEDFVCTMPSCVGFFSYRTLRALNNHRSSTHCLPDIPKRKRGPKKSDSSRPRFRSPDSIKRQVMKRAIDISKREQGCRSMARLRASRMAITESVGNLDVDQLVDVLKDVNKSLETWEAASSRRRALLERRIQMARIEWGIKGEALLITEPLAHVNTEGALCFNANEDCDVDKELSRIFFPYSDEGSGKECCSIMGGQHETSLMQPIDSSTSDFGVIHASDIEDVDGGKRLSEKITCSEYDAKQIWHNFKVRNHVCTEQHEMTESDENDTPFENNIIVENFDKENLDFVYCSDSSIMSE